MKNLATLTVLIFLCFTSNAQTVKQPELYPSHAVNPQVDFAQNQDHIPFVSNVVPIWEEDFANGIPGTWSLIDYSGICPWKHSYEGSKGWYSGNFPNAGNPIYSATSSNGFIISDVDSSNHYNYGQPAITKYHYLETYIQTDAIDLSGYPVVYLEFLQFFRYQNNVDLIVSVSNNGSTWTDFDVKGDVAINQYSVNPDTVRINISAIAGNQPNVYIRWGWNSRLFFWMIDDVKILPAPDNDLEMIKDYYNGIADPSSWRYYTKIPQRQARADTILFGGQFLNAGAALQPNTKIDVTVTGADYWQGSSTPFDLDVLFKDSVALNTTFTPYNLGTNQLEFTVSSDSTDDKPDNNTITNSFLVTDTVYARDLSNFGGQGWWYGSGVPWTCGLMYEINTEDTATSVSVVFQGNTTSGSKVYLQIYDDLYNLISSSPLITLNNSMTGGWHTWKLPDTPLSPGKYIIAFQAVSGSVLIGADDNPPPTLPDLVYTDVYNNGFWTNITDFTPLIRLNTKPGPCAGYYVDLNTTVAACGNNNGSASALPYGGASPYTYQWDANAGNATTASISGLSPGNYVLTITDSSGCTSVKTAVIEDAQPPDLSFFAVDVLCAADCDGMAWVEASGYSPFTYQWSTNDTTDTITGLCVQTYQITVSDVNNCTSIDSVIMTGPQPLIPSVTTTEDSGNQDGTASIIPTGGVTPYSYQWDSAAGYQTTWTATGLSGGQNQGYYNVTLTDGNGCDTVITVYVGAAGNTEYNDLQKIQILPNPSKGVFEIFIHTDEEIRKLEITDIAGNLIRSEKHPQNRKGRLAVDLSDIPKGLYIIRLTCSNHKYIRKLLLL